MIANESEAMLKARHKLFDAIRRIVRDAADFELSAINIDRPIAATPWLREHRYGDATYDARWYPVQGTVTHIHERIAGGLEAPLAEYTAVALIEAADEKATS